jgi:hypothetical protein
VLGSALRARRLVRVGLAFSFVLGPFVACAEGEGVDGASGGRSGSSGSGAGDSGGDAVAGTGGKGGSGGKFSSGGTSGDAAVDASDASEDADAAEDAEPDVEEDAPIDVQSDAPVGTTDQCPGKLIATTGSAPNPITGTASGGTSPNDSGTGSCGGGGGKDAIYRFRPPVKGEVTIRLSPTAYDGVLHVRGTCPQAGSEIECANSAGTNGTETIQFIANPNLDYYIFADSASSGGLHAVSIELIPELPVDSCPGDTLTFSGSPDRTATASGNSSQRQDDYEGSCAAGSASARDAVYRLTADTEGILSVELEPTAFDASLYLRTTCSDAGSQVACKNAAAGGGTETVEVWATNGTTYYAFVDGAASGEGGAYTINATLSPAGANEKCPGTTVSWTGTTTRTFTATGDTSRRWHDNSPGCAASAAARDVVYKLDPPVNGTLTLDLAPAAWDGVLSIGTACPGAEVACKNAAGSGGAETHTLLVDQATDYYVWVDGAQAAASGSFTLNGTLVPAKAGERCPGELLTLTGTPRKATVNDDLAGFLADYAQGPCAPGTLDKDAVYQFVAPVDGTINVTLVPNAFDGAVYVRTNCTGTSAIACADANGSGGTEFVSITATNGSTYYVFVDARSGGAGTFTLTVSY